MLFFVCRVGSFTYCDADCGVMVFVGVVIMDVLSRLIILCSPVFISCFFLGFSLVAFVLIRVCFME